MSVLPLQMGTNNARSLVQVTEQQAGSSTSMASGSHVDGDDDTGDGFGLVINGHSLMHALSPQLEMLFLDIACK